MTVAQRVYEQAKLLPEALAWEALDFMLFLRDGRNVASGVI